MNENKSSLPNYSQEINTEVSKQGRSGYGFGYVYTVRI